MVYIYRDLHMYCICGPYAKAIHMPLTHKHSQGWGRNIKPYNSIQKLELFTFVQFTTRDPYINCFPNQYLPPAVGWFQCTFTKKKLSLDMAFSLAPLYLNRTLPLAHNFRLKIGGPYFKSCPYKDKDIRHRYKFRK